MNDLTIAPGTYALHLHLAQSTFLSVMKLGEYYFPAGEYIYSGSAFGPGGLKARLGRHLSGDGKHHWHIDSLRVHAQVCSYHFVEQAVSEIQHEKVPLECLWSQALANANQALIPAPEFGASDCRAGCQAHLVAFLGEGGPSFAHWTANFLSNHSLNHSLISNLMR